MLFSYYHTTGTLSEHWGHERRNHNHGKLEYPSSSVFLYYSPSHHWFKYNVQGLKHVFWTWSSEEFPKASWAQCSFLQWKQQNCLLIVRLQKTQRWMTLDQWYSFLCYCFSDKAEEEEENHDSVPTYDQIMQTNSRRIN